MNQQTGHKLPSFFVTEPAPCPYLRGQMERKLFTHLAGEDANALNNSLTHAGFRRSQTIAYRPACDNCSACQSVRIVVPQFSPSKSFRRILRRNDDLTAHHLAPQSSAEQFDLLDRYIQHRHAGGGMANMSQFDYAAMIEGTCVDTHLIEYRDSANRLKACLLADRMQDGLSLVYSFFDPHDKSRSLGNYMILERIRHAQNLRLAYLYLGYYIASSHKMAYKSKFTPMESLTVDGWQRLIA